MDEHYPTKRPKLEPGESDASLIVDQQESLHDETLDCHLKPRRKDQVEDDDDSSESPVEIQNDDDEHAPEEKPRKLLRPAQIKKVWSPLQ